MDNPAELLTIADTIETNGGWHIAAVKVRAAADRIRELEAELRSMPRYAFPGEAERWARIDALLGDTTQDRKGEPT